MSVLDGPLLKLRRLTEADLGDCIAMLGLARDRREAFDAERVSQAIQAALASGVPPERAKRLRSLEAVVVG